MISLFPKLVQAGDRVKIPGDRRTARSSRQAPKQTKKTESVIQPPARDNPPPVEETTVSEQDTPAPTSIDESSEDVLANARREAESARSRGDLNGGISTLQAAGQRTPLDADTNALLASLYLDKGRQSLARGDVEQAKRDFRAGKRADPGNVGIQEQLFELETIETAQTLYDQGVDHLQRDQLEPA